MKKHKQLLTRIGQLSLIVLPFLVAGQSASATTFVSNLSEPTNNSGAIRFDFYQGSSFTTGNSSYTLDFVSALFRRDTDSSNFFFGLYSDNGGVPDAILTNFTPTTPISNTYIVRDFNPDSIVQLAANTTYWLISGISVDEGLTVNYEWGNSSSFNAIEIDGWTHNNERAISNNQGGEWFIASTSVFKFSVDATEEIATTSEPSSLVALLGLGGLALTSHLKNINQ